MLPLDNMVIVSDYNCQQVEGATDNQTCVSNMADRFNAFGAKCVECNGHDIQAIIDACNVEHEGKPLVVLCKTSGTTMIPPDLKLYVKGKLRKCVRKDGNLHELNLQPMNTYSAQQYPLLNTGPVSQL